MLKVFHLACAYFIIGVVAAFTSCTSHPVDVVLDEADALFADYPDSAYALLKGVDATSLPAGSERQARYALLYTKCQYKTYNDASTDSLISLAADYYEEHGSEEEKFYAYLYQGFQRYVLKDYEKASVSFMRAMANSESVDDSYSKGQMYGNLSLVNLIYHCTDALLYAWKAFEEFQRGGLEEYAINAKVLAANSHLQVQHYDSCRILLDQAIDDAQRHFYDYVLQEAISLKAHYAVCVDSLILAEEMCQSLMSHTDYVWKNVDFSSLASVYAYRGEEKLAQECLSAIRRDCQSINDSIAYYWTSYRMSKLSDDVPQIAVFLDSLLRCEDNMLGEGLQNTTIATLRDYSEWKYNVAEYENHKKTIFLVITLYVSFFAGILFIVYYRKRQIEFKYLHCAIEKLELEKTQHSQEYERGLQTLMHDDFIVQIRSIQNRNHGLSKAELERLSSLFCQNLPHFETSLRDLIKLSETEWNLCMLLKLSFSPSDIAFLLNKTPGAISSARLRMYQRVFHRKGHTSDWDGFIRGL